MSEEVKHYFKIEITEFVEFVEGEKILSPEEPCTIEYIKNGKRVTGFQIGKIGFDRAVSDILNHISAVIEVCSPDAAS